MELFSVKRYDEEAAEQRPESENKILKKLLKKVEKRKRKFNEISEENKVQHDILPPDPTKYLNDIENEIKGNYEVENEDLKDENIEDQQDGPTSGENFTVLGDDVFIKRKKVEMVLPTWLAYPTIIATKISDDSVEDLTIDSLPYISQQLKDNLKEMHIEKLFPVQKEVIPWLLNAHSKPMPFRPRDICVSAPTGSGKTLTFALTIIQLLLKRTERRIRALIILPVNELAAQVFQVFKNLTRNTDLSVCLLSKTYAFAQEQYRLIDTYKGRHYSKMDIVITTPGRLVEHLHATKGFCLKSLKFLVIDEADRVMEQIHHNWLYHLDAHVKSTSDMILSGRSTALNVNYLEGDGQYQPQKLLFSATLSQDPEKLQNLKLFQPKLFTSVVTSVKELTEKYIEKGQENQRRQEVRGEFIGKYTTPEELTEKYCITEASLKPLTLTSLIKQNRWNKFLCFTNSTEGAHRLHFILDFLLKKYLSIAELSSTLSSKSRQFILKNFALGKINGLVCSDALARGIDIPEVDIVISYDVPRHIKTYIHRIGRTARAGRPGTAITLLSTNEFTKFQNILSEAGKEPNNEIKVEGSTEEDYSKRYALSLKILKRNLSNEIQLKKLRKDAAKENAAISEPAEPKPLTAMEQLQISIAKSLEQKIDIENIITKKHK